MSIIGGSFIRWLIFPTPYIICLPIYLKLITLFCCLLGGLFGYIVSSVSLFFFNKSLFNISLVRFIRSIWFMPTISTLFIIKLPLKIGGSVKNMDQGWREYFGPKNLYLFIKTFSLFYQSIHFNTIKIYLLSFVIYLIFILLFFMVIN